jgi:hypothetical protein
MKGLVAGLVLLLGAVVLLAAAQWNLHAQVRRKASPKVQAPQPQAAEDEPQAVEKDRDEAGPAAVSVQDAMLRPFTLPFATPTSLSEVRAYLERTLKAPVVLDVAALDRLELKPEDVVQLQLEGVRLKTGLKLLLDQVGMTYQVIAEDNLLLLTDSTGSSDPIDRVLTEVKALHRDVHDLQDAVDDILESLGLDGDPGGAKMRKPTIIEELPETPGKPAEKPESAPSLPPPAERPRSRPG